MTKFDECFVNWVVLVISIAMASAIGHCIYSLFIQFGYKFPLYIVGIISFFILPPYICSLCKRIT